MPSSPVDLTLKGLSLKQKIGQMIFPDLRFDVHAPKDRNELEHIQTLIRNDEVGGICLFGGNLSETPAILNGLQKLSRLPLLVACDVENGAAFHIEGTTPLPTNMAVGATMSEETARLKGWVTARESRAIGINWGLVPVADVNNNPQNPVINTRSFGEDPEWVGRLAVAFLRGCREGGLLTCGKHFPGHGDVSLDSHLTLPVIRHPLDRIRRIELKPFQALIAAGVDSIMTAHLLFPAYDEKHPATLSRKITTDLLRRELKFEGLVVTDALNMGGITTQFDERTALQLAVEAGADCLLYPDKPLLAASSLLQLANIRAFPPAIVDAPVGRILAAKERLGLFGERMVDVANVEKVIHDPEHAKAARTLAEASITLVKDDGNLVPLREPGAVWYVILADETARYETNLGYAALKALRPVRAPIVWDLKQSKTATLCGVEQIGKEDTVVVAIHSQQRAYSGRTGLEPAMVQVVKDLCAKTKRVIVLSLGTPYLLRHFPEIPAYLAAYGDLPPSQEAMARAVAGKSPIRGKLPVTLSEAYKFGSGIERTA